MSKRGTMSVQEVFLKTLEELGDDEFEKFKWFLQNRVEWSQLEKADRLDTVDKIILSYNQQSAEAVKKILEKIHRNDLVTKLSRTRTGAQETDVDQNKSSSSEEAPLRSPVVKASKDALKTNTSLNHDDIISKSALIQKGPPAVYQLKPEKQTAGSVRRLTLGERNPNKINKTILLVGETGTGKSTLINALVNYAMGVKWEDDVWFEIVEDEKKSQSETQTSDVIVYEIFGFEGKTLPYSLTIIDTPGYGSTEGTDQDAIVSERLFALFRSDDGVHEIDAVGLVLRATENQLSDRLSYIFDSVMSLFGKDMEKKIVALITHSNGLTPDNVLEALEAANIKIAKDEDNEPAYFLFDNCQKTERTKKSNMALENAWNLTMDQISQLTDFLLKRPPQNLKATVEVLNSRIRLTACIKNLQERVEFIESKQKEISQILQSTEEVDVPHKVKVDVSERRWWALWLNYGGAVSCERCKENCHDPCTLAWYAKTCEVMKDHYCTVCTGECHESYHVKEKKKYVTRTKKVKMSVQDVIKKYGKGKTDKESVLENLEMEKEKLQDEKDQLLEEAFQHVLKLDQIALNVDSVSTHVHFDFLIEKMKEKGDKEKVQRLEEMKSRMEKDKGIRAALWYKFGKAAESKKN